MDPYRARLYRAFLIAAAAYNAAFGLWAGLSPLSFFETFGLEPPRYPSIWSCLGMVVGLYGAAYACAAVRLDLAKPIVALGLAGKILGPIGWLAAAPELPLRTFTLILFNDIVWWLPFALILLEDTRAGARIRAAAPIVCAALNLTGALAMLFALRPGTEAGGELAARASYIAGHPWLWRAGWAAWIGAALSLTAFLAWWGARVGGAVAPVLVCAAGNCFDLLADSIYIAWLPDRIETLAPLAVVLSGGIANGLYCAAGAMLTLRSRQALPPGLRAWAWTIWVAGFGLTASAFAGSVAGMVVSTAIALPLFCPWVVVISRKLR